MTSGEGIRQARWKLHLKPSTMEAIVGYLCISPWIIGFLVFTLGAMLASLGISFLRTDMLTETRFVGLDNYRKMISDSLVRKSLINTAYYSFAMVPLGTIIALLIALLLNQGVKLQGTFRTIYYLPSIVSGVAVAVLWAWLYNPELGLINAVLAKFGIQGPRWIYSTRWAMPSMIIMSLWGAGGSMLIFLAGLQSIPTMLYEAATIDGAGPWRRFWHITLPLLTPTIFFSVVMRIIGSWQIFTQAYVMTAGGPNNATLTVVLYLYRKAFEQFHFGYASAIAWVLFFIILGFTLLIFKSSELWVFYESEVKK
ncbi:MAG: sugar ABC transporter permease [Chloroflexi bacterium]|nr:sugar ABC transporter permease [Chloroflexota bacterium]